MRCKMEYEKLPEADLYAERACFSIFEAAFLVCGYSIPLEVNSRGNVIFSKGEGGKIKICLENAPDSVKEVMALFAPAVRLDRDKALHPIAGYLQEVFREKRIFDLALKKNPQKSFPPLMEKAVHGRGGDILKAHLGHPNERGYFPHSMLIPIPRALLKDFFISVNLRPAFLFHPRESITTDALPSAQRKERSSQKRKREAIENFKKLIKAYPNKGNIFYIGMCKNGFKLNGLKMPGAGGLKDETLLKHLRAAKRRNSRDTLPVGRPRKK